MSDNKKHYIKSDDFHKEYLESEKIDKPTNKLIEMFTKIATRYSSKYNNIAKLDSDSCINYAVMEAILKWKEYDKTRSNNIFAFFTQMIKNDLFTQYNLIFKNSHKNISIDVLFTNKEN